MELEPSKSVLQDFNNMYTKYLINKTLLDFCKQTLFCHNKNLDDDCTSLAKNIIEELAIKEYVLLKKDSKDEANNINFLGMRIYKSPYIQTNDFYQSLYYFKFICWTQEKSDFMCSFEDVIFE